MSTVKATACFRKALPFFLVALVPLSFIFGCFTAFSLIQVQNVKRSQLRPITVPLARRPTPGQTQQQSLVQHQPQPPTLLKKKHLNDALAKQGLSHIAFHGMPAKKKLASLVRKTGNVAVVGVEHGFEVRMFANEGYKVTAFEPMPSYYEWVLKKANESSTLRRHLILHNVAAGDREGTFHLDYRGMKEKVPMQPIRKYLHKEIDLLSVDVQGAEPGVLKGAQGVPIRSMWIEVSCNTVKQIFEILGDKYVIFDFVPWGQPKYGSASTVSLTRYPEWYGRPNSYQDYSKWYCEVTQKFFWLITDFVAIRRDALTPQLLTDINTFSNDLIVSLTKS